MPHGGGTTREHACMAPSMTKRSSCGQQCRAFASIVVRWRGNDCQVRTAHSYRIVGAPQTHMHACLTEFHCCHHAAATARVHLGSRAIMHAARPIHIQALDCDRIRYAAKGPPSDSLVPVARSMAVAHSHEALRCSDCHRSSNPGHRLRRVLHRAWHLWLWNMDTCLYILVWKRACVRMPGFRRP